MATPIDMSRLSAGVTLPPELSGQIQADALATNPYFALATQVSMPGTGLEFQSILTEPEAQWVGETEEKPVSKGSFGSKTVKPYKVAVIVPFSDEFKRDASRLYDAFASRIPNALTRKIVQTISGQVTAPGEKFTQLSTAAQMPLGGSGIYDQILDIEEKVASVKGAALDGYALSAAGRFTLLRAQDVDGRPLLLNDIVNGQNVPNLLGQRVTVSRDVSGPDADTLGYAGDWSTAFYGIVDGVKVSASDQATLNIEGQQVNLWQHNMFAVRAEVEVAFWADVTKFVRIVKPADDGGTGV